MYEFKPVSDRIQHIRDLYRSTEPKINISRYKLLTEFYEANPHLPGMLKRAEAYKYICDNMDIAIHDHELIVGGHAPTYRGAAMFPENSADWIKQEFGDGTISTRDIDPYIVDPEDRQYVLDTIDFWEENCTSKMFEAEMPIGYHDHAGSNVTTFMTKSPCPSPIGHFIVGHQRVLDCGLLALKQQALDYMHEMDEKGIGADVEKYDFYRAVTIVIDGCVNLANRYSKLAAEKAAACTDPKRKSELELISQTMARVPAYTPRTFFEAAQCVYFYQMATTLDAQLHGTSFGRVDQYLAPYYERDIAEGRITTDEAQEIVDFFILKIAEQNKPWGYGPTRTGPGYTSGQLITIGGVDRAGHDASNDVTYMILESSARLVLHSPPLSFRVHEGTPDKLWACAIETTRRAGGVPAFESDAAIVPALQKRGLSLEDARDYGLVGCVEPSGCGFEWAQCGGTGSESFFMLPNALLMAINNGVNPMRFPGAPEPQQTGPATGYLYEMESFEEVKQAYKAQVEYFAKWQVDIASTYHRMMSQVQPIPIASVGIEGCLENGRDVTNRGARYSNVGIAAIGVGNVADGLAAIKYLCFDKKKCTTREFYDAMMANWEGSERAEEIHAMILNEVPHFGNGDEYVDELAAFGAHTYADAFNGKESFNGTFHAGLYPVTAHVVFGGISYAGPDGRKTGDPFSDGISGVQGRDVNGPLGVLNSVSVFDSSKFSNGMLLNVRFHPSAVNTEEGKDKLIDAMKTYMIDMKGMEMQLNIVSTETMKAAREKPEEYKDLVVRIAGFSAYFVEISDEAKDDLISRTEMESV